MPPLPHQFQSSSLHNSIHSSSSSVPSTSSIPSLSTLRIGGPSSSTSPSIDSAIKSNATTATSQIIKFKKVVEYDGNGRLIIAPDGNGFIPAYSGGHMVIEAIKPFYTEPWGSWNEIQLDVRILMWNQFMCIFKLKAALQIKEHLYGARRNLEKPGWLNVDVWDQFLVKWDTPEYRARKERAKENRASQMDGSLHTGGNVLLHFSFSNEDGFLSLKDFNMAYENGGKECPFIDVYEEAHRKKDGTRGNWVETRAKNAYREVQKSIEEWRQIQPTSEDGTMVHPSPSGLNNMLTTVVGGQKKGRTYGTGVLQSSSSPSPVPLLLWKLWKKWK
ncbi:hypothetical protein FXO37_06246 [Capsicum annuum]|nr:hypothetical protein FXO37_06246 [Capsicum annuum]